MAVPTTTTSLSMDDFFSTTLSGAISNTDTVIPLNSVPTASEGFLAINQANSGREIIYYTSKDSSSVTCPGVSTGRGQGGTSATAHSQNETVKQTYNAQYWKELQNGHAIAAGSITNAKLAANAAWTSYTPTISNVTTGNGTLTAAYQQIGKTVNVSIRFVWGSTTSASGSLSFSLPVTAASKYSAGNWIVGQNWCDDAGNANFQGICVISASTSTLAINMVRTDASQSYLYGSTPVSATVPFTWGTADSVTLSFTYEAA